AEVKLAGYEFWHEALGVKGVLGKLLDGMTRTVLDPARALVREALGADLFLRWETPRGKPGLRIGILKDNGRKASWASMSGAEKAITGMGIMLAFTGMDNAPSLLWTECEVMTSTTEAQFLRALSTMVPPMTGLLVLTHHGDADMGDLYAVERW
ncbi:MAG: hypothetical protein V3S01_01150, partial [Dehalococcoidia bacterium]